jgi:hypothetical protein
VKRFHEFDSLSRIKIHPFEWHAYRLHKRGVTRRPFIGNEIPAAPTCIIPSRQRCNVVN